MINEIKNQHVHMLWGLMLSWLVSLAFPYWHAVGFVAGVVVETYQVVFKKEPIWMWDRLLDITFWTLGSGILWCILNVQP